MGRRSTATVAADVVAGLLPALLLALHSVSVGALLTVGPLVEHRTIATTLVLFGCGVVTILVALRSSLRVAMAAPSYFAAVILVPALQSIGDTLHAAGRPEAVGPTLWAFVGTATALGGVFMLVLGRLRQATLVRYMPHPIIAGILASGGWLMCKAGVSVLAQGDQSLGDLFRDNWMLPASALGLAALILLLQRFVKSVAALPILLLLFIAAAHLIRIFSDASIAEAQAGGWFVETADVDISLINIAAIQSNIAWSVIGAHLSTILVIAAIMPTVVALQASAIELILDEESDLENEFQVMGGGNLLVGAFGSVFSTVVSVMSELAEKAGAKSHLAAAVTGAALFGVLLFGSDALAAVPTAVVAGLSISLGLGLILEWLIQSRKRLTKSEYLLVVLIVGVVILFGFVQGVLVGLLAATALFTVRYGQLGVIKRTSRGTECRSNVERPLHQEDALRTFGDSLYVLELQGYLFFGTAHKIQAEIRRQQEDSLLQEMEYLLMDFHRVTGVDSSAAVVFVKLRKLLDARGGTVIWTGLSPKVQQVLEQARVIDSSSNCFPDMDRGMEWCEERILSQWAHEMSGKIRLQDHLQSFLDESEIDSFRAHLERRVIPAGGYLTRQGDPASSLFLLDSGQLTVLAEIPGGPSKRLRTYQSGTILGELGFYTRKKRSASIVAEADSTVFELTREGFEKLREDCPSAAEALHEQVVLVLATRLGQLRAEYESLLR